MLAALATVHRYIAATRFLALAVLLVIAWAALPVLGLKP